MPVTIRNQQWDVDGGGVAIVITPGIPTSTSQQVPSMQLDREITRCTNKKTNLTERRDEIQAELDAVTTTEAALIALRATVTAEP